MATAFEERVDASGERVQGPGHSRQSILLRIDRDASETIEYASNYLSTLLAYTPKVGLDTTLLHKQHKRGQPLYVPTGHS